MRKKIKEKMENILFFSRGGAALRRADGFDRFRRLTAHTNSTAVRRRADLSKTSVWVRFCRMRLRRRADISKTFVLVRFPLRVGRA